MSLLLDALRSTEPTDAAANEPRAEEPFEDLQEDAREEPLGARATLDLLAPNEAGEVLALEPPTPADVEAPSDIAVPAATAPAPARFHPAPSTAAKIPEPALGRPEPAITAPGVRGAGAAPAAAPSTRNYGVLLVALAVLVGLGSIGKLLWPKTYTVTYPEGSESAPLAAPAAPDPGTSPVSLQAVQVPSQRPVDQFAYSGNAPEIDLHESEAPPSAIRPEAASGELRKTPAAPRATAALSVTRSESESSLDRHIQGGYRALAAGNVASAQSEYLAALKIDANSVDALLGAAAAAARGGNSAVAAATYAKVLKLEPGNPDATAALAMLKPDAAASESNESHLKILIANDDGNRPALHAALAGVYGGDGRWAEAAQEYFTALAKDPGNPDLAFDVAASLDQNRNAAMALNFYQQALTFALSRPAQFDRKAVERRVAQLQAPPR
ncbi:MAG TPA: hypothetical protein VNW26_03980 [Steroidobacteraceae bacterium]|nr:hypothetical protein [Steroidobacteraceae bacterium]